MPIVKTLPVETHDNQLIRMHCAFAHAQMNLASFFHVHKLKPGDEIPQDKVIKLFGTVDSASDLAYEWTALMILGQLSGRHGFSAKNLVVRNLNDIMGEKNEKGFFDPKSQLKKKFFGYDYTSFNSGSLYEKVFKPLLTPYDKLYFEDEREKPFGYFLRLEEVDRLRELGKDQEVEKLNKHQIALRDVVKLHMIQYIIQVYFKQVEDQPWLKYQAVNDAMCRNLHNMGYVKLALMISCLNLDKITKLSLSHMQLGAFGEAGVSLIVSACEGIKEIVLDSNALHRLDPTGKANHSQLCNVLRQIPANVLIVSLCNNGLSSFNKTELIEIMQAIPSTVKEVLINFNGLDPELEQELLNSRGQKTTPLLKPTQPLKNQKPSLEKSKEAKPKEEKPVKVSSYGQTTFAPKPQPTSSSSASKDEATTSYASAKRQ